MHTLAPSLPAERVGNYQVLERLGAGGMGVVYKAVDLKLNRTVALKFLAQDGFDASDREHLLREARAASMLDHANIGTVYGVEDTDDGRLCIVMAFYDGETLAHKLRHGPLSRERAINIACQVARGLHHAHLHGVIHRDIKPSNVILTSEGVAKIVDFGLARRFTPSATTQSGGASGTLLYMAPEQAMAKPVDARADIWSLGVMLYQMLTGRMPFAGENAAATLMGILHEPPAALDELPEELQLIVYRALAKEPSARYANCAELLREIEKFAPTDRERTASISKRRMHEMVRQAARSAASGFRMSRLTVVVLVLVLAAMGVAIRYREALVGRMPAPRAVGGTATALDLYQKGEALLERRDRKANLDRAVETFSNAVQLDPNFALAYAALGEAHWYQFVLKRDRKLIDLAETEAKHALQINDQLADVHVTLGRIEAERNNREVAQQEMQQALKLDPHNTKAMQGLASIYAERDRSEEAEKLYREAVTLRPDSWIGLNELSKFCAGRGEHEKAAELLRHAIEVTPDNPIVHSNLALTLQDLGKLDEAEAEFKKSIEVEGTYFAYTMLGRLYYRQRRWAAAAATIEKALPLNSSDYRLWLILALSYEWLNENDKAARAYEKEFALVQDMFRLKPEDPEILCEMGVLYARRHERANAVRVLEKALVLKPNDPPILHNAAEAYEHLGDRSRALELIRRALSNGLQVENLERNPALRGLLRDPVYHNLVIPGVVGRR